MIFMAHANLAKNAKTRSYDYGSHRNLTDGKSLRPCLSASPSACLAHADYILWLTQISRKTRKPGPMIMAHTDLTNLTDGKSLRSGLSAAPSACLAHAENAENADFASRCALAAIRDVYTRRNADTREFTMRAS